MADGDFLAVFDGGRFIGVRNGSWRAIDTGQPEAVGGVDAIAGERIWPGEWVCFHPDDGRAWLCARDDAHGRTVGDRIADVGESVRVWLAPVGWQGRAGG